MAMKRKGKTAKKAVTIKKLTIVKSPFSKSEVLMYIAQRIDAKKTKVAEAMNALQELIAAHLKGAGSFTLPGLLKLKVVRKPATKARKGINPFTGEPTTFKAKPARNVIKVRALKKLKETV